jgi:uncharacterized repeat protein (TIGR01451 family)
VLSKTRYLLCLLLSLLAWLPDSVHAQSACTSVWGIGRDQATVTTLRNFNVATGQWSANLLTLNGNANSLAGSSANGLLYYVDRVAPQNLYSINPGATTLASTLVGPVPPPPAPAVATNILGATTDAAGNLFVYVTDGIAGTPSFITVAQISVATAATLTSWTQIRTTTNGTANLASSGDSFVDQSGNNWMISNTNPPTLHRLDLNVGASFGRTNSPALSLTGVNAMNVAGVSTDPLTGKSYVGGFTGSSAGPLYSSVTFEVNLSTGTTTALVQTDTSFFITDMGNCASPPAAPTISKSFSPTSRAVSPGTSTLQITIGNTNTVPIYLYRPLIDAFPTNMTVAATPVLQGSCVITGNTITATSGANSVTFASGGRIPAGGCTYSFVVSASANGAYVNTIPVGSLTTSSGSNAAQAQATFQVAVNDFSLDKQQRTGANAFSSGAISVAGGSTIQYVLNIVNGAGSVSAGTVNFVDTLPPLITPTLTVTAVTTGGGTCSTATAVVGTVTRVSGTYTAAPIGATCTVTITARTSVTAVLSTFPNSATMGPVAPSVDSAAANNSSTVTMSILPGTTLTIAKTDGKVSTVAGSTNSYTITVANLGPAAADNATVRDPPANGLNCSAVTCTTAGGAVCPGAPLSLATFQTSGIPLTSFPSGSTASFVLTCGVTATGQ